MFSRARLRYLIAMGVAAGCEPGVPAATVPTLVNEIDASSTIDDASVTASSSDSSTNGDGAAIDTIDASTVAVSPVDASIADARAVALTVDASVDAGRRAPAPPRVVAIPAEPDCSAPQNGGVISLERRDRQVACDDGRDVGPREPALAHPFDRCVASYKYSMRLGGNINATQYDATFSRAETTRARAKRPAACCYVSCVDHYPDNAGRALRGEDGARVAPVARGRAWSDDVSALDVDAIPPADRWALANAWLAMARAEHASIASFARVSLQLLALGAPPALIADTHAAAIDEIAHARTAFAIASRLRGEALEPDAMSFDGVSFRAVDAATLALETFEDACVGETIGAMRAREDARSAPSGIADVLGVIADDEERHAELAWRTLKWAIVRGGDAARARVREALARAIAIDRDDLATRVVREIIVPCANAALDRANVLFA